LFVRNCWNDPTNFFSSGLRGAECFSSSWDLTSLKKLVLFTFIDSFEQVLVLPGHRSAVWGMELAPDASFCVTAGQDRSIRLWRRTEDMVFVEEERFVKRGRRIELSKGDLGVALR
jgi:WD40 repeat protein